MKIKNLELKIEALDNASAKLEEALEILGEANEQHNEEISPLVAELTSLLHDKLYGKLDDLKELETCKFCDQNFKLDYTTIPVVHTDICLKCAFERDMIKIEISEDV